MNTEKTERFADELRKVASYGYQASRVIRTAYVSLPHISHDFLKEVIKPFNDTLDGIIIAEESVDGEQFINIPNSISEDYFRGVFTIYSDGEDLYDYLEKIGEKTYKTPKGNIIKFSL